MLKKLLYAILLCATSGILYAQVRLPRLISKGMVLQRDAPIKIWGWASPGEKIAVRFENEKLTYRANTSKSGEWSVILPKRKAGGPHNMIISGSNQIVIEDILIGDVWLCSGQSNMEQPMSARLKYKYAAEVTTANNDRIRHFLVPDRHHFKQPQTDVESGPTTEHCGVYSSRLFFRQRIICQV